MKIAINLASQPSRRERPVIVATVLLSAALAGLLAVLVSLALTGRGELADTRLAIDHLNQKLTALAREQAKLDQIQRKPENAQVLERSVFLNSLLYRKAISWTRIFADLEEALPHNVRINSIRPYLAGNSQINLEMLVGSDQTEPLLEMLKRLESSEKFGGTAVSSRIPPAQNEPLFRYKVNVNYAQRF